MHFVRVLLNIFIFFSIFIDNRLGIMIGKETVEDFINKKIEVITKTTTTAIQQYNSIELREPALSLFCSKTRGDKIKFVKDINGYLFFLSINELFAIKVNNENVAKLHFVGTLLDIIEEDPIRVVQIEKWQNLYMVVVQQSTKLKVYLVKLDEDQNQEINHIHMMNFDSIADKFMIFRRGEDVLLVIYQIQEQAANKLTFYKWHNSFFMKESSDTTELPNKGDLFVYNENPDETLIISLGYGVGNETSHVTVFKYDEETNRWLKMQKMHFKKDYIELYTIRGKLYLIGCFSESFCALYKWNTNENFQRFLKLSNNVFEIIKSIYSRHNIIIIENFQQKLSFYLSNNITNVEPALMYTKSPEVSQYSVYKSPHNHLYFVQVKLNATSMFISLHEMAINVFDKIISNEKDIDPIECILKLKKTLKIRAPKISTSEKSAEKLVDMKGNFNMNVKSFLDTKYVRLQDTKLLTLKMPYNVSVQTKNLIQQSFSTNIQLARLNQILKSDSKFEFRTNEGDDVSKELDTINVKNLIYNGNQPIFKDFMTKSQPILSFSDPLKLIEITTSKLVVQSNQINSIKLDKLLNLTKVQSVSGKKIIHSLKTNELNIRGLLNSMPVTFLNMDNHDKLKKVSAMIDFNGNINAKHLNVKVLNGYNMSYLMDEFCINDNRTIVNGDLFVKNKINAKKFLANHIKSIPINNLLTTITDQRIDSNVFISKFHANVINASLVNNEDINETFAVINQKNHIEVPTKFMRLNIMDNLNIHDIIDEGENEILSKNFVEMIKRHVIGTKTSDLTQIYNNKVIIRGSLTAKDVSTYSPRTKIFVANKEVPQNISENFWMKSIKQQVLAPIFKINNQQAIISSGLVTQYLNWHPIDKFLLLSSENPQGPIFIRFTNAIVEGNVVSQQRIYPSMLNKLSQLAIHRDSSQTEISSPVEFRNQLTMKNLNVKLLNNVPISTLVHKNLEYILFDGVKAIENLEANQIYVDKSLIIENYNNVNLEKFSKDAISINQPIYLEKLQVENFTSFDLKINEFEGHNFNEMMNNIQQELNFNQNSKKGKRSIRIHGNAEFKSNIFIDFLNDNTVQFNEFLELLAMKNNRNQEIGGRKIFSKDFTVKENLQSETINGRSINRLLHKSLSRDEKQVIEINKLYVNYLKVKELHTNKLNSLTWNNFIDKSKLNSPLFINLEVNEIEARNMFTESASLDIRDIKESIKFPKRTKWNYIFAVNGSNINFGDESQLDHLMKYGVKKSGEMQEIYGDINVINSRDFWIKNIKKRDSIISTRYSSFNISILSMDSVKNNSPLEVVTGFKSILNPYRLDAKNLIIEPKCYFSSSFINEINVKELNRTIHRKEDFLNSEKYFENLFVDELYIENGLLNGINPNQIVFVSNSNPEISFLNLRSLEVGNMEIKTFNTYSFDYLLDTRLRKFGDSLQEVQSLITFSSVQFENDTRMTSINNLFIDDAVFTSSDQEQIITGHIIIHGKLILKGPISIGYINGVHLKEFYDSTVKQDDNFWSHAPLHLPTIELKNGMHVRQSINGRNVEELLSSDAHTPKLNDLVSLVADVKSKIDSIEGKNTMKRENRRMLYVDIDENVEFKYKDIQSNARSQNDNVNCETQNELEFNPQSRKITISKRSDSEMIVELKSVKLRVVPNLVCKNNFVGSKEIELWWDYQNHIHNKTFRNFSFQNTVVDVKFSETSDGLHVHMILVLQNEVTSKSEIAILWLNKVENDWEQHQETITNLYKTTKVGVVEAFNGENYMAVSTYNENEEGDMIYIYRLDQKTNRFELSQQQFIGGNFDIILGINLKPKSRTMRPRTFLLFSRANGKEIKIYRIKDGSNEFTLQRIIDNFSDNIVEILVLYINEMPYFIVSQRSGLFCMYEWRGIESWQTKYCGRFENIHQMKSFEYLNRQHLFLASIAHKNAPSINALAIYRQGDFY